MASEPTVTDEMIEAAADVICFHLPADMPPSHALYMARLALTAALAVQARTHVVVRHKKRGTTYEVLGEAEAQVAAQPAIYPPSRLLRDGDSLTVYRGDDGKLWARFSDEFNDGRFEPVASTEDRHEAG